MTLAVDIRVARADLQIRADLDASDGETVALLGPNGAGKSTVVDCLAGLLEPDEGRIALDDETWVDVAGERWTPAERRPVGVVFQNGLLIPHLSAIENVAFPLRARGEDRSVARERATDLLTRLGFPAVRADARPNELSGGEAQRVALARALIHEPRLLLLDEPLTGLDPSGARALKDLLRERAGAGIGVLVSTHLLDVAERLCDRVVIIDHGRTRAAGTFAELRGPDHEATLEDVFLALTRETGEDGDRARGGPGDRARDAREARP